MQQDQRTMQGEEQLSTLRRFSFGAVETDISLVGQLIVEKYLGIPYAHRGRTMDGLDCWGFLKLVYADLGFRLFDVEDLEYEKNWGLHGRDYFKEHYQKDWESIQTPVTLDGVLFVNSRGIAYHAGIVLDEDRFIHSCRAGVVIGRLKSAEWASKTEGFYRLRGRTW